MNQTATWTQNRTASIFVLTCLSLINLRWFADHDSEEDVEPSSITNPIVFSEDPITCSNEMVELANDLVDVAVTNIAESEAIMDASHIEDLSLWKKRWERFKWLLVSYWCWAYCILKAWIGRARWRRYWRPTHQQYGYWKLGRTWRLLVHYLNGWFSWWWVMSSVSNHGLQLKIIIGTCKLSQWRTTWKFQVNWTSRLSSEHWQA